MSAVPSIKKLTFTHTAAELLLENVIEKEMVFHKMFFNFIAFDQKPHEVCMMG